MIVQVVLLLTVVATSVSGSDWPAPLRSPARISGAVVIIAGVSLALAGARSLGPALTPLPQPKSGATLSEDGVYRFARHPIYGGLLLLALGVALIASPWALVPGVLLGLVLYGKSIREEGWLVERFPEYVTYRERVRHRFVPFVW